VTDLTTLDHYQRLWRRLRGLPPAQIRDHCRNLCRLDLFFLLRYGCRLGYIARQWWLDRCREVQANPDGYLDLWARGHGKTTCITFGKTIQDILSSHGEDPLPEWEGQEVTICILSHVRPIAKSFLRQIKQEFEQNNLLKEWFSDVLYQEPQKEAPKWSLAVDTPVLTVSGWKPHGDLEPGDKIFGSKGQVITVTGNSGQMDAECRRVVFDDCEIVASADHLWPVERKKYTGSAWKNSRVEIQRTEELKPKTKTARMFSTPIVQMPGIGRLSVDPYILGLWLGDGTAGTNIISTHRDDEAHFLAQARAAGYEPYIHRRFEVDNFSMYGLPGLKKEIDALGCLRKKHVPRQYLFAPAEDRLALLQGLMDSDGTCKKNSRHKAQGMCTFCNTNDDLAQGVFHLAVSLGLRPSSHSFSQKQRARKRTNHVYFVGLKSTPPFRNLRKLSNCKEVRQKIGRYLRKIEYAPRVPVNCIRVDAEDSLYLAGYCMVPTHNSEDEGVIVKRKSNPREATVEAYGLVDGMPTAKHFNILVYDDVVTERSVTTTEMISKTTRAWELSRSLGMEGTRRRFAGTRYDLSDTYAVMLERQAVKPRMHPATADGKASGKPVFLSAEEWADIRATTSAYILSCQHLLDPTPDEDAYFKMIEGRTIRWYDSDVPLLHVRHYGSSDCATKKGTGNWTAHGVIGIDPDDNWYLREVWHKQETSDVWIDALLDLADIYRPLLWVNEGGVIDNAVSPARRKRISERRGESWVGSYETVPSVQDKPTRAIPFQGRWNLGKVYLPRSASTGESPGWVTDLLLELRRFPNSTVDDQVDMLSLLAMKVDELQKGYKPKPPRQDLRVTNAGVQVTPQFVRELMAATANGNGKKGGRWA